MSVLYAATRISSSWCERGVFVFFSSCAEGPLRRPLMLLSSMTRQQQAVLVLGLLKVALSP